MGGGGGVKVEHPNRGREMKTGKGKQRKGNREKWKGINGNNRGKETWTLKQGKEKRINKNRYIETGKVKR